MATYTMTVDSVCSGGEHIVIGLKKDGAQVASKIITKTEATTDDANLTDIMLYLIKRAIKDKIANPAAKQKTAIEAIQVII